MCHAHFKPEDFKESLAASYSANPKVPKIRHLKEGVIPSLFPWSSEESESISSTEDAASLPSTSAAALPPEESVAAPQATSSSENSLEIGAEVDVDVLVDIVQNDGDQGEPVDIAIQVQADSVDRGAQTRQTGDVRRPFSIQDIKDNPKAVLFYTSFVSYKHFCFVLHCLGPAAYHLDYKSRSLDTEDEFFMFLMKLRLNHEDEDLSFCFGISKSVVGQVFHTWLQFVFYQLKELVKFIPKDVIDQHMPKDFKSKYPATRVILDATECEIEKPGNVKDQRATWSTYKNCNTLKTMIGISPKGAVTYVSPSYGGACSDRQIIERSELLRNNMIDAREDIMADRGIMVQDLFASQDVKVNTPHTMKGVTQLPADVVIEDWKIASKRVHIERVIGLAKTYKILSTKLGHSRTPAGGMIIFVCFALCNFRLNIVPNHC